MFSTNWSLVKEKCTRLIYGITQGDSTLNMTARKHLLYTPHSFEDISHFFYHNTDVFGFNLDTYARL